MIPSASYSKIVEFEKCKYRTYLLHDAKIPEPQRPLAPGKTEHANDRGSRVHDAAEQFVRGNGPFPVEMSEFRAELTHMRDCFALGIVSLEGEWAMDIDWCITPWSGQWYEALEGATVTAHAKKLPEFGKAGDIVQVGKEVFEWIPAWLRLKIDALVFISPIEAVVIDYKTGRKFGNEVKHAEQTQLYTLVTFLRFPELETVTTELWYPDVKELTQTTYTRKQALRFKNAFNARARAVTECTTFPPNPNKFSCKWCMYGPWGSNDCKVGVQG